MQLVEHHRIDRPDPRWSQIAAAAFASKNLYNSALYVMRQTFIHERERVLSYNDLDKVMQPTGQYKALPAKVAQWVMASVPHSQPGLCYGEGYERDELLCHDDAGA